MSPLSTMYKSRPFLRTSAKFCVVDLYPLVQVYSVSCNGQLCVWECDTDLSGLVPYEVKGEVKGEVKDEVNGEVKGEVKDEVKGEVKEQPGSSDEEDSESPKGNNRFLLVLSLIAFSLYFVCALSSSFTIRLSPSFITLFYHPLLSPAFITLFHPSLLLDHCTTGFLSFDGFVPSWMCSFLFHSTSLFNCLCCIL